MTANVRTLIILTAITHLSLGLKNIRIFRMRICVQEHVLIVIALKWAHERSQTNQ